MAVPRAATWQATTWEAWLPEAARQPGGEDPPRSHEAATWPLPPLLMPRNSVEGGPKPHEAAKHGRFPTPAATQQRGGGGASTLERCLSRVLSLPRETSLEDIAHPRRRSLGGA